MLFAHNSNLTIGTDIVHVQTEDRGASHLLLIPPCIGKAACCNRRTNNYLDLLPLERQERRSDSEGSVG